MPRHSMDDAIATAAVHPVTAMVVDREGTIVALVPHSRAPDVEFVSDVARAHYGLMFHLFPQGAYSREEMEKVLRSIAEGYGLMDAGKLDPGMTLIP